MDSIIGKAVQIAQHDLMRCTTPDGIIAGRDHFIDLWARDGLFAAADPRTIETFLRFQRADGAIPYRIFRRGGRLIPDFRSVQSGGFVPDGGLMVLLHRKNEKALAFYRKRYPGGLISEWFQCEWADAVLKRGYVLYTNVLYWKVTGDANLKKQIHAVFWNGRYFADWVDRKRQDYFASLPNMLAILYGLASLQQAQKILTAAAPLWKDFTLQERYPKYPWWRIPVQNYLAGVPDYHNGCLWLQPGILYAMALRRMGNAAGAKRALRAVAAKIAEYNGVYELYEQNGRPVRRRFYRAEHPFAWSAGLFLQAARAIGH